MSLSVVLIGLPVLIVACVYSCILLYRYWNLLQRHGVPVSPGRAVGYCFIPFFSFYWYFVAYVSLVDYYNNFVDNVAGNPSIRISRGLAIANCVLAIAMWMPYLGLVAYIPFSIVYFLLMREIQVVAELVKSYNIKNVSNAEAANSVAG